MRKFLLLGVITFYVINVHAQIWLEQVNKSGVRFEKIKNEMQEHFESQPRTKSGKIADYKQYKRWEHYMGYHLDENGIIVNPARSHFEKQNYLKNHNKEKSVKSSGNWTLLGPTSATQLLEGLGRIDCAAIDPNNDNIIFAGAPTGGLWKTADKGNSWNPCTDKFTSIGISSIVINPQNTNIIYIATGDRDGGIIYSTGVYKSVDSGNSFQPTGLQFNYSNDYARSYRLMLNPNNPDIIYLASSNGFFVSSDSGFSWNKALIEASSGNVSNYEFKDFRFKPNDPSIIYAVNNNNFYKSIDGGKSFTHYVPSGLESLSNKNTRIDVVESRPENVYLLIEEGNLGQIYKSENSGTSFTLLSGHPNIGSQTHYNLVLEIKPDNPNEIYAGGQYLYKSLDEGNTWERAFSFNTGDPNYSHADFHYLEFHKNTLINGNDGGIYISSDGGNTWNNISNGLSITQIYRLGQSQSNENLILAGSQDNGTSRYISGIWGKLWGADGMETIIDYSDPNIIYFSYQSGGILRSLDGGHSVSSIHNGITETGASWVTPYILDPINPEIIYAAYSNLWKSTDRGDTWTKMSDHTDKYQKWIAIAPSNTNYIYMTNGPTLFKTTDGCVTWEQLYLEKLVSCIAVSPTNPEKIWITYSGYLDGEKVFMSEDAGSTFTNISGSLPNVPITNIVYQNGSDDGLYIGTAIGVFYKDNTMSDWIPYDTGLPNVFISELEIHYPSNKLRAATFGRGLWESPLYKYTEAPTAPGNLTSNNILTTSVDLNWTTPIDNSDIIGYDIYNSNSLVKNVTDTFTTVSGLTAGETYTFTVKSKDAAGNESSASNALTITLENGNGGGPVYCNTQSTSINYEYITNVQFGSINQSSVNSGYSNYTSISTNITTGVATQLSITTSGNYSSDELVVYIDYNRNGDFSDIGEEVFYNPDAGTAQTYTANITAPPGTSISEVKMRVILYDPTYNSKSSCGDFNYGEVEDYTINIDEPLDIQAPTTPTNLTSSNVTQTSVYLHWNSSTDNIGVTGYDILNENSLTNTVIDTFATIPNLIAGTSYSFNVQAKDAKGNISATSNIVTVVTENEGNGAPTYCEAKSNNTAYEHIINVQLESIDNSSSSTGFGDYSSLSTVITAGVSTQLSITTTKNYSTDELVAYIDYNNDRDFADPGEEVYYNSNAGAAQTYTMNIIAPLEASIKGVIMRIILFDPTYNNKTSCGEFNYGEVEDYTINIIGAAASPTARESIEEPEVFLYPNPNKGNFTISIKNNFEGQVYMDILNINGQLVAKKVFEKITMTFEKMVKNLNLKPGSYALNLKIGNKSVTKMMIVE